MTNPTTQARTDLAAGEQIHAGLEEELLKRRILLALHPQHGAAGFISTVGVFYARMQAAGKRIG